MKRCIILVFLLPVVSLVMARQPLSPDVQKRLAERQHLYSMPGSNGAVVNVLPLRDTGKADLLQKLLEAERVKQGGLVKGTYSHTTTRGKVYTLTPDNMPCLVSDMKAVAPMPNGGGVIVDDKMNRFPRQRIIPKEDKAKVKE
ncbi:MAG: hypothetical protein J7621_28865 [Niastella sp.]|nr:hypothetical protein [Niastella sp.]